MMANEYVDSNTWIVEKESRIVAAYDSVEDAVARAAADEGAILRRLPRALDRVSCAWGVIADEDHIDSLHGGDAEEATARAQAVGGYLLVFLAAYSD